VREECPSGGRQLDAALRPIEQGDAELLLELADLLAQRRLRDSHPRGGAAEVQLLRDGEEVAQVPELHRGVDTRAARGSGDVSICCLVAGRDFADVDGHWARVCEIGPRSALLVRPDQHVAWRAPDAAADPDRRLRDALSRRRRRGSARGPNDHAGSCVHPPHPAR
jgi:hypothetical protein